MINYQIIKTPIGAVAIAENNGRICRIEIGNKVTSSNVVKSIKKIFKETPVAKETALLKRAKGQMAAYFVGKLKKFNLPLAVRGTDFQKAVWNTMLKIPAGKTMSYGEIARKIKRPRAFRAIGQASHHNNIPIVIPCHRVVGSNGDLTGYGGGISRKKWLLSHEGAAIK